MINKPEPIGSISRSRADDESIFFVPAYDFYVTDGMEVIPVEQAEAYAAERVREALEQAAAAVELHDKKGREFVKGSLWDQLSKEASDRIRALIPKQ